MNTENKWFKIFSRYIAFVLIMGVIITSSVLINYYGGSVYRDSDWDNVDPIEIPAETEGYNVVFDSHSHTLYSDGELTLKQNVLWHQHMGYNACVITDHNTMEHREAVLEMQQVLEGEFVLILGMEYTTDRCHINFLGLDNWDFEEFPIPDEPTDQQIQDAIGEAHRQDAVVVINHIPWSINEAEMDTHPTRAQLLAWGVDYVEIVNDNSLIQNVYDYESLNWANESGFGKITATDMHRPDDLDSGGIHGWTLLKADTFSEEGIMAELQQKDTEIVYDAKGKHDAGEHTPWYVELSKPFDNFGALFMDLWDDSLDWAGVWLYVFFFSTVFIIFEIGFELKRKAEKKLYK